MFIECSWLRFSRSGLIAAAIVILGLNSTSANAVNRIDFDPASQSLAVGSELTLNIIMNFDEVTVGGGLEVTYSSGLTFQSFDFDPTFTANFALSGPDPGSTAEALDISFGWLIFTGIGGETGTHTVGQLVFQANGPGLVQIVMAEESNGNAGAYYGPANLNSPMNVEFGSATINVVPIPIPEPQTGILLGLGLLGLSWAGGMGAERKEAV
ncbi:MAG: PEP-CTERM sorting domain-containing protein [Myxococcales bacterium]|nr:PEP-CTERM sorting domain-containing protein [Myxococcales bacterium]